MVDGVVLAVEVCVDVSVGVKVEDAVGSTRVMLRIILLPISVCAF